MPDIAEQIHLQLHARQKESGARMSEQAKQIIVAAVSAIVYDPHQGWRLPSGMGPWPSKEAGLGKVQQDAINKLPELLDEVARKYPDGKSVNPSCYCI